MKNGLSWRGRSWFLYVGLGKVLRLLQDLYNVNHSMFDVQRPMFMLKVDQEQTDD